MSNQKASPIGCLLSLALTVLCLYILLPFMRGPIEGIGTNIGSGLERLGIKIDSWAKGVAFLILLLACYARMNYTSARTYAIRNHCKSVPIWFGMARLVLWEQDEALLILRKKRLREVIYGPKNGGGLRIVWTMFGEEMRVRIPLGTQLTEFHDSKVLTRELVPVTIRVAYWWRVVDVTKYWYQLGKRVAVLDDGGAMIGDAVEGSKALASEQWVRSLLGSSLRSIVANENTTDLITSNLPAHFGNDWMHDQVAASSANGKPLHMTLATQLLNDSLPKVRGFGLELDRVEVLKVELEEKFQESLVQIQIRMTERIQKKYELDSLEAEWRRAAEVLGIEAAIMRELISKLPIPVSRRGPSTGDVVSAIRGLRAVKNVQSQESTTRAKSPARDRPRVESKPR